MQNALVLGVFFICFCLTFNYTFPLHKSSENATRKTNKVLERSKKMAATALKRIKVSTQDMGKNLYDHLNVVRQAYDNDLKEYQQLVIKKKYPYVEFQELDALHPGIDTTRHNLKGYSDPSLGNDPGYCEALVDNPSVEITNRGLSGFAIPPLLSQKLGISDLTKLQTKNPDMAHDKIHVTILSNDTNANYGNNSLASLKEDLSVYLLEKSLLNKISRK